MQLESLKYTVVFTCLLFVFPVSSLSAKKILNDVNNLSRIEVNISAQDSTEPTWKTLWDQARTQIHEGELHAARILYQELLKQKPNIVEARWEYCKLLVTIEDFAEAAQVIEVLLELEPNNHEYLITAGELTLINKHYSKAVDYYGQVYEASPYGEYAESAIKGLVKGFRGLGKEQSAYFLLEQYYQRNNSNIEILTDLARLSKKLGYNPKARFYYSRLAEINPTDKTILATTADLHEKEGLYDKAADYWSRYLNLDDDYLPFHRKLAQYYLNSNNAEKALVHLIKVYKQDRLSTALALQIGEIYNSQLNRPDKALLYFEQYNRSFPFNDRVAGEITQIRKSLAQQYLPIVENDAANKLWQDLDLITLNKKGLFLSMADLLEEQGKIEHEASILEILHNEEPENLVLTYRLALLYKQLNRVEKSYTLLLALDKRSYSDKEYLLAKSEIELLKKLELQGLNSLVRYLDSNPENLKVVEDIIRLAGKLGLVDELIQTWQKRPVNKIKGPEIFRLGLVYTESLRNNSLYSSAEMIYEDLIQRFSKNNKILPDIYFHRADSLYHAGFVFEAEQSIRQILAKDLEVDSSLQKLVEMAIQQRQYSQARSWLNLLAMRMGIEELAEVEEQLPQVLHFLNVEILIGERELDDAEERLLNHKNYTAYSKNNEAFKNKSDRYLAIIYYIQDEYELSLEKLNSLRVADAIDEEMYVLEDSIQTYQGKTDALQKQLQKPSVSQLIERAEYYQMYDRDEKALITIEEVLSILPNSVRGQLVKLNILSAQAQYDKALQLIATLKPDDTDSNYLERRILEIEFKSGNFAEVVKSVPYEEIETTDKPQNKEAISRDDFFWRQLLLARALWAENRREEAIKVYDSLLAVPVDTIFLEKMEVQNVNFNLPPLKKSLLNVITFTNPAQPDPMTTIMDPQFFTQNIGDPVDDIAASLYGKYRWQKLIRKELSARQAIEERDYYRAEKEYLALIKEEKSEETLFDLAYIYNKLGYYGKEAELFELLKKKSPLYPGLDEYIDASVLKRQPRIAGTFINSRREGRDGYINMKKRSWGVEGWLMPTFDQEIKIGLFRNAYSSFDRQEKTDSNRLEMMYSTYFEDSLDLNIGIGTDNPTDSGTTEVLYKFEIRSRLSDSVEAYGRFEQDLVEDTIRSVTDSIVYRDLEAGFKYDLIPRLFLGADYRFRMYSDDNEQNRYKLWTMYHLFGELKQFKLKYSYENIRNNSANVGRDEDFSNFFRFDDRVYWSPNHYWQHLFTAHYKHIFDVSVEPEAPLSYFSFDYSYGYEEDFNQLHAFDVNIFLEMDRHFLLKGNVNHINGDDYEETFAVFSLIYRW